MRALVFCLCPLMFGCTALHHVQVGGIDARIEGGLQPFQVVVEVPVVDTDEVAGAASGTLESALALFTMGPRTGLPLSRTEIGRGIRDRLLDACPSGEITGVTTRRESRRVPFASLETVRIKGYCIVH